MMNTIWPSFVLILAIARCEAEQTEHLIIATESDKSFDFYESDFDLSVPQKFLSVNKNGANLHGLYIDGKQGEFLYWGYENSPVIERFEFAKGTTEKRQFGSDNSAVFVGPGKTGQVYLFYPKTKKLSAYDFDSAKNSVTVEVDGTDMHCVDIDPRKRNEIFYAECKDSKYFGKVLDVDLKKVQEDYNQELPVCFDGWRITLDAIHAYGFKGSQIYLSPVEGDPFISYAEANSKIIGFAAGNKEIFYSTDKGNIFKLTNKSDKKGDETELKPKLAGKVVALAAFQRTVTEK